MDSNFLEEMKPASDNHIEGHSKGFMSITMQENTGGIYFNKDFIDGFGIISGDRVGLFLHPKYPTLVMIYITQNQIGTLPIKKSKNNPYKIYDRAWVNEFRKRFRIGIITTFKLYINKDLSIKATINGVQEKCYMIYDKTSERSDIDEFTKAMIIDETREIFEIVKNAGKNDKQ